MENFYWLGEIQPATRKLVGDKVFYLSELLTLGYPVVPGFAISSQVLRQFWQMHHWLEPLFAELPHSSLHLNVEDPRQLSHLAQNIRHQIRTAPLYGDLETELIAASTQLEATAMIFRPSISFLGKADKTMRLNISGLLESHACRCEPEEISQGLKRAWGELFRARSLYFFKQTGIGLEQINLAILAQPIWPVVAAGEAILTPSTLEIQATRGLGHSIRLGQVLPDVYKLDPNTGQILGQKLGTKMIAYNLIEPNGNGEYPLFAQGGKAIKPSVLSEDQQKQYTLSASELEQLRQLTRQVGPHLGLGCRIEWVLAQPKPHTPPQFFLTQAEPYQFQDYPAVIPPSFQANPKPKNRQTSPPPVSVTHQANPHLQQSSPALKGISASSGVVKALVYIIPSIRENTEAVPPGRILIAPAISPDWLPWLKTAAGVVAEQGGMTSHGAILARELGIPAVVGVAGATQKLVTGELVLLDGSRGEIYRVNSENGDRLGSVAATPRVSLPPINPPSVSSIPSLPLATQLWVNLSQPSSISRVAGLPVDGVGLVRSELMLVEILQHQNPRQWLQQGRSQQLLEAMTEQMAKFATAFAPRCVFYRSGDFHFQEWDSADSSGATLGFHGTFTHTADPSLFDLELQALLRVRRSGYANLHLILPFVRSVEEFVFCRHRAELAGLTLEPSFQLWIMAEVPSVVFLLPEFVKAGVQGIAIGSNDLTQLLLAADRNHPQMAAAYDERHPAVLRAVQQLVRGAKAAGIPCSFCGASPAHYPELIDYLVRWGVTAISVEPDAVQTAWTCIARSEQRLLLEFSRRHLQGTEEKMDF